MLYSILYSIYSLLYVTYPRSHLEGPSLAIKPDTLSGVKVAAQPWGVKAV